MFNNGLIPCLAKVMLNLAMQKEAAVNCSTWQMEKSYQIFKTWNCLFFFNLEIDLLCDIRSPYTGTTFCNEPSSTSVWQDKDVFIMCVYLPYLDFQKWLGSALFICFRPPSPLSRLYYKYYSDNDEFGKICLCGEKEKTVLFQELWKEVRTGEQNNPSSLSSLC